jgi:hypothetical protein
MFLGNSQRYEKKIDKACNTLMDVVPNRKSEFNLLFNSSKDPFYDLFKPMPFWKLMKGVNKSIARGNKFVNKYETAIASCSKRAKSVPKNATIRKEYVKCMKSNCYHDRHGPFHYAYWKDPVTKKLKKKYIGRHFERGNISANMEHVEHAETSTPIESQSKSETTR